MPVYARRLCRRACVATLLATIVPTLAGAQSTLPVRQLGKLERVSNDSTFLSIASVVALPGGSLLINDRVAHRVLLLDSMLAVTRVVADTSPATGEAYGRRPAGLIRFRGDSALLLDQVSLSMYVIDPHGAIARVMAMPRAEDAMAIAGSSGLDAQGRLVYFDGTTGAQGVLMLGVGEAVCTGVTPSVSRASSGAAKPGAWVVNACLNRPLDSLPLVRVDLATRALDTIARLAGPTLGRKMKLDANGGLLAIESTYDPLPVVDAWAMTSNGTIAVLRSRDYHIDWIDAQGARSASPKMPFDWKKVDDARKAALIDSTVARWQGQNERIMNGGGRGATGLAALVATRADPATVSDYFPPITDRPGALAADRDGNIWIRTTTVVDDRPVYDVVNSRGDVIDRVQLPAFRTIAGFDHGVIYLAVQDAWKKVRLERVRIR